MEIRIDKNGYLWIKRKNEFKEQACPYFAGHGHGCGDWCPLFNEPTKETSFEGVIYMLELCGNGPESDKPIEDLRE